MILVRAQVYFGFIQRGVFVTIGSNQLYLLTLATVTVALFPRYSPFFGYASSPKFSGAAQRARRRGTERVPGQEVAESTSHTILPRNGLDKQKRGERCTCTTAKPQGR